MTGCCCLGGERAENWDATTSRAVQVLISIQSLILVPQPYFNEPGGTCPMCNRQPTWHVGVTPKSPRSNVQASNGRLAQRQGRGEVMSTTARYVRIAWGRVRDGAVGFQGRVWSPECTSWTIVNWLHADRCIGESSFQNGIETSGIGRKGLSGADATRYVFFSPSSNATTNHNVDTMRILSTLTMGKSWNMYIHNPQPAVKVHLLFSTSDSRPDHVIRPSRALHL